MVIRMRHNRSQTKQRRSHHGLTAPALSQCANCGANRRPHHMCPECGFYKGRQVLDVAGDKAKREVRLQAKRDAIASTYAAGTTEESTETEVETKEEKK